MVRFASPPKPPKPAADVFLRRAVRAMKRGRVERAKVYALLSIAESMWDPVFFEEDE